jgi:hypothetical protein
LRATYLGRDAGKSIFEHVIKGETADGRTNRKLPGEKNMLSGNEFDARVWMGLVLRSLRRMRGEGDNLATDISIAGEKASNAWLGNSVMAFACSFLCV